MSSTEKSNNMETQNEEERKNQAGMVIAGYTIPWMWVVVIVVVILLALYYSGGVENLTGSSVPPSNQVVKMAGPPVNVATNDVTGTPTEVQRLFRHKW